MKFIKLIALFLSAAILSLTLFSCSDTPDKTEDNTENTEDNIEVNTENTEDDTKVNWCSYKTERDISGHEIYTVKLTVTDYGEITLLLDATTAPITVANFLKLVSEGFYNGLTFHRIIENFMIQGGDPLANGTGGSDEKITGEFSSNGYANDISHIRGVISMARSNNYNSASSQFFICSAHSTHLDGDYAAFGYVIDGLDVVDKITEECAGYGNGIISNKALQPVIEKIEIINGEIK